MNLEAKNIIIRDQIEGDLDALKVIAQEPSVKKYFTEEDLADMKAIVLKDKGTVLGAIALNEHPELHEKILALGTRYAVEDVNKAFEDAYAGKNIKTMLVPKE